MYCYIFSDIFEAIRHIRTEAVTKQHLRVSHRVEFESVHIAGFWDDSYYGLLDNKGKTKDVHNFEESLYSPAVIN